MKSIGSFAEELVLKEMTDVKEGKKLPPMSNSVPREENQKDIRETVIPNSFMSEILGEEYVSNEEEEPVAMVVESVEPVLEESPTDFARLVEEFSQMIVEFRTLLEEAKEVLGETTSVGMIGTGYSTTRSRRKKALSFIKKRKQH
jgi:hypothetical protein